VVRSRYRISLMHQRHIVPGDRPYGNVRGTRSEVMGRRGMIATSQPLASSAGLHVLRQGGNAIDAAVTAAAVLSVVEPTMTGIGGDLFALVFDARQGVVRGLNASGRAGSRASHEKLRADGHRAMPLRGPLSVTVPGAVRGWDALLRRFGTIGLDRALQPAIEYARDGFPVSEIVAGQWQAVESVLAADPGAAATFLPCARVPRAGEVFSNPDLGRTLQTIASGGADAFYRGETAREICRHLAARGGLVDEADFAACAADWVDPLHTTFRGSEVFELPPNTQGFVVLEMLNILDSDDLRALGHNSAAYLHLLAEAKRIAFADRDAWLADDRYVPAHALEALVSKEYGKLRRRDIDPHKAAESVRPGRFGGRGRSAGRRRVPSGAGDTVYLTVVDGEGNAVSLIQSLFESFGSAVVPPGTGVVLQNRGSLFVLDPSHPNRIDAGKRPLHTLIPAMVFQSGRPVLSFGVMGGDLQPQGHVQVLVNLLEFRMNVQEAGEAARIRHSADGIAVESGIGAEARAGLEERGHRVFEASGVFGGYQAVAIDHAAGVLIGGSDPRKDGLAIGY
jgi:gamma-glutamyltranspeptidase / glutathione hydrolase